MTEQLNAPERHSNQSRNLILNKTVTDLDRIINQHDPEIDVPINQGVWDRLDKMAMQIEALSRADTQPTVKPLVWDEHPDGEGFYAFQNDNGDALYIIDLMDSGQWRLFIGGALAGNPDDDWKPMLWDNADDAKKFAQDDLNGRLHSLRTPAPMADANPNSAAWTQIAFNDGLETAAELADELETKTNRPSVVAEKIRKLIDQQRPSPMAGWRTMDSAPKDGTWVLGFQPRSSAEDQIEPWQWFESSGYTGWINAADNNEEDQQPTHWMPLPPSPTDQPAQPGNPVQEAANSVDHHQQTGRAWDIITEAIAEYDNWMLDDDYEAGPVLERIVKRMKDRRALAGQEAPND